MRYFLYKIINFFGKEKLLPITFGIPIIFLTIAVGVIIKILFFDKIYPSNHLFVIAAIILLWLSFITCCIYQKNKNEIF